MVKLQKFAQQGFALLARQLDFVHGFKRRCQNAQHLTGLLRFEQECVWGRDGIEAAIAEVKKLLAVFFRVLGLEA